MLNLTQRLTLYAALRYEAATDSGGSAAPAPEGGSTPPAKPADSGAAPAPGAPQPEATPPASVESRIDETGGRFDNDYDRELARQTYERVKQMQEDPESLDLEPELSPRSKEPGQPPATPEGEPPTGQQPAGQPGPDGQQPELVEVDGKKYFYHPEVHAKGEKTHSNAFETKEKAEEAARFKALRLHEKLQEMKEQGVGPGALVPPKALEGNLDLLETLATDPAMVHEMEPDTLRSFIKEADQFYPALEAKQQRHTTKVQAGKMGEEFNNLLEQVGQQLDELGVSPDVITNEFGDREAALKLVQDKAEAQIAKALKPELDKIDKFLEQQEADPTLTPKELAAKLTEMQQAVDAKHAQLTKQYEPYTQQLNRIFELADQLKQHQQSGTAEVDPAVRQQRMMDSLAEFQADRQDLAMIQATDKTALKLFTAWAMRNAERFNWLQQPGDVNTALDAYNELKKSVYATQQKQQLQKQPAQKPEIPGPAANQHELTGKQHQDPEAAHEAAMDELERMTRARLGLS